MTTPLDVALSYIERGWSPLPVPFKSKEPVLKGWPSLGIDTTSASQYFNGTAQNIGVLLGPASAGLTDVDLDCAEARAIASYVLPPGAAMFGRASARASHRLYITNLAEIYDTAVMSFDDPLKTDDVKRRLVDLRIGAKGAQTVFPGSTHPSGEAISWEEQGDPAKLDGEFLKRRVELLAVACLFSRYWPGANSGRRHDAALTVGGFLHRAGVDEAIAQPLVEGIARAAGDEEWKDRKAAAAVRDGVEVRGYPKLVEMFGNDVAETTAEWIGYDFRSERSGDPVAAAADVPVPLFPPLPPATRFPVECLGGVLSKAALAIARKVQVPEALAAQSVLATASLAAQAIADVQMPYGQTRPLSLFHVTIAATGERKSTADDEATWPLRKREKELREIWQREQERWNVEHTAWGAEKRKIETDKRFDFQSRKEALTLLGPAPEPPLQPFLTAPDPTLEGLIKSWVYAPASIGLFSAEGGQFIGGHGMSADHRLKTAAGFSEIWNGVTIKRIRAGDGLTILPGRRLSMHMLVQPGAAAAFFSDPILRDQGLLSRVLVTAPDSIAGTRLYRETDPADDAAIKAYGARILEILEAPWPLAEGERNILEPPALVMEPDAESEWRAFYDAVERRCAPCGDLVPVLDFASKAAEHTARIAGVLTVVSAPGSSTIDVGAMGNAVVVVDWYINETLRLQRAARTDPKLVRAQRLLDWLQANGPEIEVRDLLRLGPASERTKTAADESLAVLKAHGWVREVSKRPHRIAVVTEMA